MLKSRSSTSFFLYFAFLFMALAIYCLSLQINHLHKKSFIAEDLKYLPSGKFLKGAALSYDEVIADLLWIKAIAYFGEHAKSDQDYTWLHHILDITTTLDPLYSDPYEFGGIVLGSELGDIDKSIAILKKGMKNVPKHNKRYWYLPFFTAFNYMFYKGDNLTAAKYLETAAKFPQRPDYLPLLVSRLYANTDDPLMAIPFLEEMIAGTNNQELQEKLRKRINEIIVMRDIKFLEKARNFFLTQYGRLPESLEEMVEREIITSIPPEPFGGKYLLNPADSSIYSNMTERLELHLSKNKDLKIEAQEIE